jgi:xanthine/uracil/vitamin C permease (AzgA family)
VLPLNPKIKYALGVALSLNAATIVALVSGTIGWREALAAILAADLPVLAGYLKGDTPPPAA